MNKPIQPPTLEEFLACCNAECAFLVSDYGFARLHTPKEYNAFSVRFRREEFGVDLIGENWGQSASCELVRGGDELALGFLVPQAERQTKKGRGPSPGQLAQIHNLAVALKRYASDFLSGDTRRFDL